MNRSAEGATGTVYAFELFGACLGALLAGAVVAPVLGIVACYLLAATAAFTALAELVIAGRAGQCQRESCQTV